MEEFYCYNTLDEVFNQPFNITSSHYASKKLATLFQKAEPRIRQPNVILSCEKCQSNVLKSSLRNHLKTNKYKNLQDSILII
jgi:hypothetical protein